MSRFQKKPHERSHKPELLLLLLLEDEDDESESLEESEEEEESEDDEDEEDEEDESEDSTSCFWVMIILGAFFKCSLSSSLEHRERKEVTFQRRRDSSAERRLACDLRQSSQSDGGEEVDGEASVSGVVPGEEAFEERLQGPKHGRVSDGQDKSSRFKSLDSERRSMLQSIQTSEGTKTGAMATRCKKSNGDNYETASTISYRTLIQHCDNIDILV